MRRQRGVTPIGKAAVDDFFAKGATAGGKAAVDMYLDSTKPLPSLSQPLPAIGQLPVMAAPAPAPKAKSQMVEMASAAMNSRYTDMFKAFQYVDLPAA